jgi:hypothetical protein
MFGEGVHDTMASMDAVNIDAMLARFTEHWSPKKIAQINDYDVRIVKLQGDFTWHNRELRARGEATHPWRALAAVTLGWAVIVAPFRSVHDTTEAIAAAQRRTGLEPTAQPKTAVGLAVTAAAGLVLFCHLHRLPTRFLLVRLDPAGLRHGPGVVRAAAAQPGRWDRGRPVAEAVFEFIAAVTPGMDPR